MSHLCFLCSRTIHGDEQFYQHHVNQCLDNVGAVDNLDSERSSKEKGKAAVLLVNQSDDDDDEDEDEDGADKNEDEEVDQVEDHEPQSDAAMARALALDSAEIDGTESASGQRCPCCQSAWSTLGIVDDEEKEEHAGYCFGEEKEGGWGDDIAATSGYQLGNGVGKTARGTSSELLSPLELDHAVCSDCCLLLSCQISSRSCPPFSLDPTRKVEHKLLSSACPRSIISKLS